MFLNIIKISILTFFSKIIGFIRDILIANIFGINIYTDAFYTALKFPNMLRKIFAEGAFSYVFIPILSKYKEKKRNKINELISSIYFLLSIILIIITILGIIYSNNIIYITAPGFVKNSLKTYLTIKILRIIFPFIIIISLSTYISSILNVWNIFILPTFAPIILNIIIIIFILFINKYFYIPIMSLAWSIIFGSIFQLIYQKIILKNISVNLKIKKINIYNNGIKKIIKNIIPVILGMFIYQMSQIINNSILSYLQSGSISWIYYADRLIELPLTILGTTIGTILLSKLSNNYNKNNKNKYNKIINQYLKIILLISLPTSIILIFASKLLVIILFKYGKFSLFDVIMTSKTLKFYSLGLTSLIFIKILTPCFYSRYNTKIPIKINILTLIITQIINIFTVKFFKHAGIALSISISSFINMIILCLELKRNKIIEFKYKWKLFLYKIIFSCIIMTIFIKKITENTIINFINLNIKFRLIKLFFILLSSIIVYIFSLFISGFKIKEIL